MTTIELMANSPTPCVMVSAVTVQMAVPGDFFAGTLCTSGIEANAAALSFSIVGETGDRSCGQDPIGAADDDV